MDEARALDSRHEAPLVVHAAEALRGTQRHSGALRSTQKHSGAIRSNQEHSGAIISNQKLGEVRKHLVVTPMTCGSSLERNSAMSGGIAPTSRTMSRSPATCERREEERGREAAKVRGLQSEAIRSNQEQSEAIRSNQKQSEAISGHGEGLCGAG